MGGNAFEGLKRLNKEDYNDHFDRISNWLGKWYLHDRTKSYSNKESFGDLDIIVSIDLDDIEKDIDFIQKRMVRDGFHDIEFKKNGNVLSFKHCNFQTDLIFVDESNFDCARFYYSYNDLHCIIGRVAHKLGVKFGSDGLWHSIKDEGGANELKTLLTKDPNEIYDYLGYSYERYLEGFDSVEDIFEFIASSKYFNKDIFSFENLDHRNRTRNRKRKNYSDFVEWTKNREFKNNYQYDKNKQNYLIKLDQAFPKVFIFDKIERHSEMIRTIKILNKIFNGNLVSKWTGLKGSELGKLMKSFNEYLESINSTPEKAFSYCKNEDDSEVVFLFFYEKIYNKGTK